MEELFQSAITSLNNYPEAPFVLGIASFVFLISFIFVTREVLSWYLKTSRLLDETQALKEEVRSLNRQIDEISELLGRLSQKSSNPWKDLAYSSEETTPAEKPTTKKEKGFPLSH